MSEKPGVSPAIQELKACRCLIDLICNRAARLYACGIAAICKKKHIDFCHVALSGSVFKNYSQFRDRVVKALRESFEWPDDVPDV